VKLPHARPWKQPPQTRFRVRRIQQLRAYAPVITYVLPACLDDCLERFGSVHDVIMYMLGACVSCSEIDLAAGIAQGLLTNDVLTGYHTVS
jgi:hypothetical protein